LNKLDLNKVLTILFLLSVRFLIAQPYASTQGAFQVDQKEGCAPLTIHITEVSFTGFCTCNYKVNGVAVNGGDGKSHTFNSPGTYVLTGSAQAGANPAADQITITVNPNTQPDFELSSCNNNQVSIKVTTTQFDSYLVDFDNNSVVDATILAGGNQSTISPPYGSSGLKTISVRGKDLNAFDNCMPKLQTFTAIPTLQPPVINTLTVNNAEDVITLGYTPAANYQYKAQVSTNSASAFQLFQTLHSVTATLQTLTLSSLSADANYYCFRLNSYDACMNNSVSSNIICSANFDAVAASDVNQLSWVTSATGVSNYTVMRDLAVLQTVNTTNHNDNGITCHMDYEYALITNYANGSTSTSASKTITSITNTIPDKIENTSAVVGDNLVDLNWQQPAGFTANLYSLQRSSHSGTFEGLTTSLTNQYTDNTYNTEGHYCYQISYTDVCTNSSPLSSNICPIQLTGSLNNLNQIQLDWSGYEGWKLGVKRYSIEKFDATGALLSTVNRNALTYFDAIIDPDNQIVSYRITAEPKDVTQPISQSNTITFKRQARLIFPTAFTPNRDHLNDTFTVEGQYVESLKLQVFDRWGVLLFSTEDNKAWDGMHDGKLMPESTYIWKAFITDKAGDKFNQIGSVALLRK
jgi:gliding motility-associated-like protein